MLPIQIQLLGPEDMDLIYAIDRSEEVLYSYEHKGDALEKRNVSLSIVSERSFWDQRISAWREALSGGAVCFGAMDGDRLAGFSLVDSHIGDGCAQLLALYVSAQYRLSGIAKSLFVEAEQKSKRDGASQMYLATPPTGSAVGFYLSQGFVPVSDAVSMSLAGESDELRLAKSLL